MTIMWPVTTEGKRLDVTARLEDLTGFVYPTAPLSRARSVRDNAGAEPRPLGRRLQRLVSASLLAQRSDSLPSLS